MSQFFYFICIILLCVTSGIKSAINVPETIDENGDVWVGPIRKCILGSTDLELDTCVEKITKDLTPKVGRGLPEIGLVPLDTFVLDKLNYNLKSGPLIVNLVAKNLKFNGFSKYNKLKFHTETLDGQTLMHFVYEVPALTIDTMYKVGGNAVFFPISGSGPAHIEVSNVRAAGHMVAKKALRAEDGIPIVQIENIELTELNIGGFNIRVRGLFPGNPLISTGFHYIANQYSQQVFELLKPEIMYQTNENLKNKILNPVLENLPYLHDFLH